MKRLIGVMLAFGILLATKTLILIPYNTPGIDFDKHYYAAEALVKGMSPYTSHGLYLSFNYPQFVAWTNLPLLLCKNVGNAETAWDIFNMILVFLTALVVCIGYKPGRHGLSSASDSLNLLDTHWWIPGLFFTFFFAPNTDGISDGNVSSWVLIFITLLGWAVLRGKEYTIGLLIALSSLIKVMPVLLIIPYLIGGKRKVLLGAGIVWGAYILILAITGTLGYEWFYITKVLPNIGEYWDDISYSLPYVILRYTSKTLYHNPEILRLATLIWNLALIISYVLVCFINRDIFKRKDGHIMLFAMGTILLPFLPPLLEYHHLVWTFPGLLLTFYLIWKGMIPRRYWWAMFTGFFFLSITGPFANVSNFKHFSFLALTPVFSLFLYLYYAVIVSNKIALTREASPSISHNTHAPKDTHH
jgi:hypothetical protein